MPGLVDAIMATCARSGPAVALRDAETCVTYDALGQQILFWQQRFRHAKCGPRAGFILPNRLDYVPALFGAIGAGVVPFLMDPGLPDTVQRDLCESLGLDMVLADPARTGWLSDGAEVVPGLALFHHAGARSNHRLAPDTVLCRFTTGTSGVPKCLEFSDRAVLCAAETWATAHRYSERDIVLCLAAFFNGLAFNTCFSSILLAGGTLLVYPGLPAPSQVIRYAIRHRATRLIAFPAFYQAAAAAPASFRQSQVAHAYSAASRLGDEVRNGFREAHGLEIADYYGLAEAGPITHEPEAGVVVGNGVALPGCEMRCRDGVLEVRTPYMATSYLNLPGVLEDRLDGDGFLRTQDRAEVRDGRLFLMGRADNIIDIGGRKFDPSDTLKCLLGIPGIRDAFVFGAHGRDGRGEVRAAICSDDDLTCQDIRRLLGGRIEGYKIPSRIVSLPQIPRNGAGKPYAAEIMDAFEKDDR